MKKQVNIDTFLTSKPDELADRQLLSFLLSYCDPESAKKADMLLAQYGNLANLLDTRPKDFLNDPILTEKEASLVRLVSELHRRYLLIRSRGDRFLRDRDSIANYLLPLFAGEREEIIYLLSLDDSRRVLGCDKISQGEAGSVQLPLRVLLKEALLKEATAVVLAHNHPSGLGCPSNEDITTTEILQKMLVSLNITLIDHMVFFDDSYFSMSEYGYIIH